MKKNPASQSGLFNPRVLVALSLCFVGVPLAMLSFAANLPSGVARSDANPQGDSSLVGKHTGPLSGNTGIFPIRVSATRVPSIPYAWGYNVDGELGNGTTSATAGCACVATSARVSGLTGVIAVAGGGYHSLALKSDGTVWAWGYNGDGELGNGTTTTTGCSCIDTPVQVSGLTGVTAIAGGGYHSLALKSDGTVWAWGQNRSGELGNGTKTSSNTPVQVSGLTGVVTAIAGGAFHSLALKSDGTVWAWGFNVYGALGNGTTTDSSVPVQVSGLTGMTAIAGGYYHSLAIKSGGTVWAWGSNSNGQLGNGTTVDSSTPVQVIAQTGLSGATAIGGGLSFSLALKSDGTVWAWGANGIGQLGNGCSTCPVTTVDSSVPVQASGLTGITAIAAGYAHSLALKSDGAVWAWGDNAAGQLGDGGTVENWGGSSWYWTPNPVLASSLKGVTTAIAAGGYYSLALQPPPVQLVSVVSELTHGGAGTFDINLPLTGNPGIECRSSNALGNGNYEMIFTFANPLTSVKGVSVTSGTGTVSSNAIGSDSHQYIVNLTGVTNAQYITVSLANVTDSAGNFSGAVSVTMGVLIGDVNGDGFVLSGDYTTVRANSGNNVDQTTFRYDINADGFILSGDYTTVRKLSGTQLPPPPP